MSKLPLRSQQGSTDHTEKAFVLIQGCGVILGPRYLEDLLWVEVLGFFGRRSLWLGGLGFGGLGCRVLGV